MENVPSNQELMTIIKKLEARVNTVEWQLASLLREAREGESFSRMYRQMEETAAEHAKEDALKEAQASEASTPTGASSSNL